jgi:hypothetical protein
MRNRKGLPINYFKDIVSDLRQLSGSNEGRLFMLDLFAEVPRDTRPLFLDALSAFREEAVVEFIEIVKIEFGKEYEQVCNRILDKMHLAGMPRSVLAPFKGRFYKAYASRTRHTGRLTLDIAWETGRKHLHVECFYLTFNSDGIHSFFLVENMLKSQYDRDRKNLAEISLDEACFLVSKAYHHNLRYMSRPALGRFLYQKYLLKDPGLDVHRQQALIRRLSARLSPRQLVNSIFHAYKYQDWDYIVCLLNGSRFALTTDMDTPVFIEGGVRKVRGDANRPLVEAYSVVIEEGEFYYHEYLIRLLKEKDAWSIVSFEETRNNCCSNQYNPFNCPAFCRVYEIIDLEQLSAKLDELDGVREVKELPEGMHMRLTYREDDFNRGVSFMSGVVADLVINGDELVIICQNENNLNSLHDFLVEDISCVIVNQDYQVSVLTALRYLSGQFACFEDALLEPCAESACDDGMRLISAHYHIKDRQRVLERLQAIAREYCFQGNDFQLFYQVQASPHGPGFEAEYIMGSNWVAVSTFGDSDMSRIRQQFEADMYGCLEFEGIEIRKESIFDILTADIKKSYPQLPAILKELYLNKWVHSRLSSLQGMSPCEACQTEEGSRLLWALYKRIKRRQASNGSSNNIILKEYIRKIEQE